MTDRIHDFRLVSHCHAVIEEIRGNPHPRIHLVSRSRGVAEKPPKEVGIFPSSFNPVTKGHMAILRGSPKIKAFQELVLVLDTQAMDKEIFGATLVDRLLMLRVLFEDHRLFSLGVSNRGLFLTKLELLREMYPEGTNITFIVGFDTLTRVFDPEYYEEPEGTLDRLFAACTFMVANRGDRGKEALRRLMTSGDNRRFMGQVHFFQVPNRLAQISSSRVRQRVREGKAFARLVPGKVREFIEKVRLYQVDREVGPQGQRVNVYDLRTRVLRRLYALYPEGGVGIDIGEIVDTVVEGMGRGQMLEMLLDSLPRYILGEKKSNGIADKLSFFPKKE
jgi:nicotinamide-nucleotide adenylyltransferase